MRDARASRNTNHETRIAINDTRHMPHPARHSQRATDSPQRATDSPQRATDQPLHARADHVISANSQPAGNVDTQPVTRKAAATATANRTARRLRVLQPPTHAMHKRTQCTNARNAQRQQAHATHTQRTATICNRKHVTRYAPRPRNSQHEPRNTQRDQRYMPHATRHSPLATRAYCTSSNPKSKQARNNIRMRLPRAPYARDEAHNALYPHDNIQNAHCAHAPLDADYAHVPQDACHNMQQGACNALCATPAHHATRTTKHASRSTIHATCRTPHATRNARLTARNAQLTARNARPTNHYMHARITLYPPTHNLRVTSIRNP